MVKGGSGFGVLGLVLVLSMVLVVARQSQAINCGQVSGALAPCLPYLTKGGAPSSPCCDGVRKLRNMAPTQQDRRTACQCAKDAAARFGVKPDAASKLPSTCGVPINIPISSSVNCRTIP